MKAWATSIVFLGLLAAQASLGVTVTGGTLSGAQSIIAGTGGVAGVEKACTDAGSGCVCSEMFQNNDSPFTSGWDFTDSPDAFECLGNRSGASALQVSGNTIISTRSVTGWGSITRALDHSKPTGFEWVNPPSPRSGALAITASDHTYCMRYYMQVDDAYSSAGSNGGDCPGTNWRNKTFQFNFGGLCNGGANAGLACERDNQCPASSCSYTLIQGEEYSASGCAAAPGFSKLDFYVSGPGLDARFNVATGSGNIDLNDCDGAPCEIQLCLDGDLSTGQNIVARARYRSLEGAGKSSTGVTSSFSSTGSQGPSNVDFDGADRFHSGPTGNDWLAMFMVRKWAVDTDQWIPPSCEIEGGC